VLLDGWWATVVVLIVLGAACSSSPRADRATPVPTAPGVIEPARRETCPNPSRFGVGGAANELRGSSTNGELWGLVLGPGHVPPHLGDELKIVWRMTGSGPLRVAFAAPDGISRPLVFGPEAHAAGSSYHRPGDEWGTGFRFDASGCWHIHLARNDTTGDVWLDVGR
jgi:hypothetical protein